MSKGYLLSIDMGTSSLKTVLFKVNNHSLEALSSALSEYPTLFPQIGWAEQNPQTWWEVAVRTISEVFKKNDIDPKRILAIGIASQSSIVLPVDKQGKVLYPALIWLDRRSRKECKEIKKVFGVDPLFQITGNVIDPSYSLPKLLWMRRNLPQVYKNTYKFLQGNDYLIYRLTHRFSTEISEGGISLLFNTKKGDWSDEIFKAFKLEKAKFPEMRKSYDVVGKITKQASRITGLSQGTPVVAGAMDMVASSLGAGALKEGQAYVVGGTATNIGVCREEYSYNKTLLIYHHPLPHRWISAASVDFGGGAAKWFQGTFTSSDSTIQSLPETVPFQDETPPLLFLPYMLGQRAPLWDNYTRGCFIGLTPQHKKTHMWRALLEGVALGLKKCIAVVEKDGYRVEDLKIAGGLTKIPGMNQIFSDVTGKKVIALKEAEVSAYGAALLAGMGVGLFKEPDLSKTIHTGKIHYPHPKREKYYRELFTCFQQSYKKLKTINKKLSEFSK